MSTIDVFVMFCLTNRGFGVLSIVGRICSQGKIQFKSFVLIALV